MNCTTSSIRTPLRRLATPMLVAASMIFTGCSVDDDEPDAAEPTNLTNVQPVGAARIPNPAEVPLPPQGESASGSAIVEAEEPDNSLTPVEHQIYAIAKISPASGSDVRGEIRFHQDGERVRIRGMFEGLEPGEHGLHVHAVGDCSAPDASSAKGHFAPDGDPHGSPEEPADRHHVGDLGNITADESGIAQFEKSDAEMSLETGDKSIVGRAMIVHAEADDLTSQPSGAAGARVGCGIIELDVGPAYRGAADSQT